MNDGATKIDGIRVAAINVGVKQTQRPDLCLFEAAPMSTAAAVFTNNKFAAAPVLVAKNHLASGHAPRYLLINSGNANCGTGKQGFEDAKTLCKKVAEIVGCKGEEVLPFSTGVIGQRLPVAKIAAGLESLCRDLSADGWDDAATAIMTTDTRPKSVSSRFKIGERLHSLTGIAKGAGMIKPNMATMLSFIATDVAIATEDLRAALKRSVSQTFNRITIDGDTSTNDAVVLFATGEGTRLSQSDKDWHVFETALTEACENLAKAIIADGEGATKFVEVAVKSHSEVMSSTIGFTVAESPLVKTALFASDPNWGRILAAIGRAPVEDFNIEDVAIFLGDYQIVDNGSVVDNYDEAQAAKVMKEKHIKISIEIGDGDQQSSIWTTDLSYDYVKINAEYRT
ncbi:MAG: bifunctional glutamate N-acetyltransferase/amino-acid acetyltransferase ArgJ [Gammaproteobacteria bacterium]